MSCRHSVLLGWLAVVSVACLAACSSTPAPTDVGSDAPAADDTGVLTCSNFDAGPTPTDTGPVDMGPRICLSDAGPSDGGPIADVGPLPDAGGLPDLTVDVQELGNDIQFTRWYFPPNACEIAEGCVDAPGWRTLLMFTTFTPNSGTADLVLGSNLLPDGGINPAFEYSTCHMHYHFRGYADYTLLDSSGCLAAHGHKQSFCVEDLVQVDRSPGVRTTGFYGNCGQGTGQQGISRGWADDYYPNLPCQWIDVTDVPPGTYTLNVAINTLRHIQELNYDNDTAHVSVTIPADYAAGQDPTTACGANDPNNGAGRNCGWFREGVHTCSPGERLSVGCNAMCGVGSCDDSNNYGYDIRICRGDSNCRSADAVNLIAADSGECGTGVFNLNSDCGVARFSCPPEGRYTVLVQADGQPEATPLDRCHLATVSAGCP